MLKALGTRGMVWDSTSLWPRRIAAGLLTVGAAFLLGRAQSASGLAPLAMALLAAGLRGGMSALALLAGCLLAGLGSAGGDYNLLLPIGAAVALGGSLAWDGLIACREAFHRRRAPGEPEPRSQARSPNGKRAAEGISQSHDQRCADKMKEPSADGDAHSPARRRGDFAGEPAAENASHPQNQRCADIPGESLADDAPHSHNQQPADKTAESPAIAAALAGAAVLIPGLAAAGGALWPSVQALGAALTALAAAPFFASALHVKAARRTLAPEERTGLFLAAAGMAAGLSRMWLNGALTASAALTFALWPAGAAAGVGLGGALTLARGDARLCAALGALGWAAQAGGSLPRRGRFAAATGAALALGAYLGMDAMLLASLAAAGLGMMALPRRWTRRLEAWARPIPPVRDPERLAAPLRRRNAARLRAIAGAFGDLAEGYRQPEKPTDEQAALPRLRQALCEGCAGYAACWSGGDNRGARFLCDLMGGAVAWSGGGMERPLFDGEMPPDVARRCRRAMQIPERLGEPLEDFARARRLELKRGAENRLISAQFDQARRLLEEMADAQARPLRLNNRAAARAAAALEREGLPVEEALAPGSAQILVTLRESPWTEAMARRAAQALTARFGRAYAPAERAGREARFIQPPRLRAQTGAVCASRRAGEPSGDSHVIARLEGGRLLALISDGMGSGADAARESAAAVRLLGRFLAAGADTALAIDTANALLLHRCRDDMFATVDLMTLDLTSGMAEFTKLAASPSLIARAGEILSVEGGRLPLGILERVHSAGARMRLLPGDILLMASDGVMDCADPHRLTALLRSGEGDMTALAERVLRCAEEGGGRRDDMTVICLRILEQNAP